jgi:hypothetical protein
MSSWSGRAAVALACCAALVTMVIGALYADAAARPPAAAPTPIPTAAPAPRHTSLRSPTPRSAQPPASSTPSPTAGTPPAAPSQDSGGCGFFDVACKVKQAINGWFKDLVKGAINPVFGVLGKSLLATPHLDESGRVRGLWTGSLVVANASYVLLVVIGGLLLMGRQTLQTSYAIKDIAPRLVVGMVASNVSLLLIGKAITFANALSAGLLGQGVSPDAAAGQLQKIILHAINPVDVGTFLVIVVLGAVLLGTILLVIYIVRIMLTIVLIAAAPLALACHALPPTEYLAKLWWRAIGGVLAIQVAQSLVFIAAMRVFFTTDNVTFFGVHTPRDQFDIWITVCLLYVLVRIPSWISRMIWQGGLSRSPIVRITRTIAAIAIFRRLGLGRRGGRRGP